MAKVGDTNEDDLELTTQLVTYTQTHKENEEKLIKKKYLKINVAKAEKVCFGIKENE